MMYITGALLLIVACVVYGYKMGNRDEDCITVECPNCLSTDIKETKYWYQCKDCGEILKR